ncbi:MAG: NAD-dependent epimerase/dehydratase family protein [Chitinophagales bacterium]
MKILIAGGAGYIGSVVIPKVLDRGYDVEVIDLLWFGNNLPKEVKVHQKDIFNLTEKDVEGFDVVIFLAGLSNDPMAEFSPAKNFISNASSTAYLAYIAKRAGVKRFIYAGSCSVYGYTVNELYDETKPASSSYPYGISKLQGEQAVMQMQDDQFSVIAFRQGTVSGYSPRMRLDLIVNTMFKTALTTGEVIINNPSIWRPILAIQDAANAYVRAIEAAPAISGIFNIASGNYTVGEVADYVKEAVEKKLSKKVKLNIKNIQDFRNYKVSVEKAMNMLSFKPAHNVESILDELITNIDKFRDFDNPNYYNIQVFRNLP